METRGQLLTRLDTITNSLSRISDSLERLVELQQKEKKVRSSSGGRLALGAEELPKLITLWNCTVGQKKGMPQVVKWVVGGQRDRALRQRLKEHPDMEWWRGVMTKIIASSFLTGENERGWRADVDWLLRSDTAVRVMEGRYDDKHNGEVKSARRFLDL